MLVGLVGWVVGRSAAWLLGWRVGWQILYLYDLSNAKGKAAPEARGNTSTELRRRRVDHAR